MGLFFIWAAVASPLAVLDHEMLTAHMAQHLLLMTLAPPLIWLGAPVKALLGGLPPLFVQVVIAPLFCSPLMKGLGKTLTQPADCLVWSGCNARRLAHSRAFHARDAIGRMARN